MPARPVLLSTIVVAAAFLGHSVGSQNSQESIPALAETNTTLKQLLGSLGKTSSTASTAAANSTAVVDNAEATTAAIPAATPQSATATATATAAAAAAANTMPQQAALRQLTGSESGASAVKIDRRTHYNTALQAENRHLADVVSNLNQQLLQLEQELLSVELELLAQDTPLPGSDSRQTSLVSNPIVYDLTNTFPGAPEPQSSALSERTSVAQSTWSNDPNQVSYNQPYLEPLGEIAYEDEGPIDYDSAGTRIMGNPDGSNLPVLDDPSQAYDPYGNPEYDPSLQLNYTVDGYNSLPYQSSPYAESDFVNNGYVGEQQSYVDQNQNTTFLPAPDQPYNYNTSP